MWFLSNFSFTKQHKTEIIAYFCHKLWCYITFINIACQVFLLWILQQQVDAYSLKVTKLFRLLKTILYEFETFKQLKPSIYHKKFWSEIKGHCSVWLCLKCFFLINSRFFGRQCGFSCFVDFFHLLTFCMCWIFRFWKRTLYLLKLRLFKIRNTTFCCGKYSIFGY